MGQGCEDRRTLSVEHTSQRRGRRMKEVSNLVQLFTLGVEPVGGLGTERQKAGGGVFLLEVETAEDL